MWGRGRIARDQHRNSIEGPLSAVGDFQRIKLRYLPVERNLEDTRLVVVAARARRAEMEMQCTEVRRSRASALPCAGRGRAPGCPLTPLLRHFSGRAAAWNPAFAQLNALCLYISLDPTSRGDVGYFFHV